MTRLQDIEKGHLFTFDAPIRELSEWGANHVYEYIARRHHLYLPMRQISKKEIDDVVIGDHEIRGKLFSRIEQYLFKGFNFRLDEDDRQRVSMMISQNMIGGDEMKYFDVVNFIRWRPGSFKESTSSCWWHSRKTGKQHFQAEMSQGNAVAIRLFRPATQAEIATKGLRKWYKHYVGTGRCFAIVNTPENVDVIFNGYGLNYHEWATFLQNTLGYAYTKPIELYLGREIYVNNGGGEALSDLPIAIDRYEEKFYGMYPLQQCQHCSKMYRGAALGCCDQCYQQFHTQLFSGSWTKNENVIEVQIQNYNYLGRNFVPLTIKTTQIELDNGVYRQCDKCNLYFERYGFNYNNPTTCRVCR